MSRKLDAAVAEHVMGLRVSWGQWEGGERFPVPNVLEYSTDLRAAFEVIQKVGDGGIGVVSEYGENPWSAALGLTLYVEAPTWTEAWQKCLRVYLKSKGVES